ncbi:class I SAM-dependent methyltransferase [Mycobacterium sp. TY814]|uniref:class I SAM-dependent methyltransferase n=1 Tax=unclassified Mycobacterium TaxID=2642494 RepID=UPI00274063B4|nr:class I SAM-dependent methyltransferase [Mycobacterium sp. TY814]MDP7720887.1 class I SAM-dependent methyltransferase [Mycobacterium sp. TY814]
MSYPDDGHAACLQLEDRSFWFRHRNRCIASVARRFPPEGVLLDIGGGNGYVSKGLTDAGFSCALVEPGVNGARAAFERGVDPVICARLEDIGLARGSISAAGMFDVLEHIEDEAGALRRIHSLLRPGGRLFLTVPAYAFLFSTDDVVAGHFRRYTLRSLKHALAGSGFRPEYATYIFAPLPPFIFAMRTLPSLRGRRRPEDEEKQTFEHVREGVSARVVDRILEAEAQRVEAGRPIPFGSSCLAVYVRD